ncbi:DinB family protein [Granulicella paludicola]|uniref:DinB family protein n=1 Tax=Granulicella paludicola TaxID=474951 RepID=UPI0021E02449|nr:DinB family protein [Granulicella paludicola]
MTIAEMLLQDFDTEISNTRRTLERVPEGQNEWTPHEKSMKIGKLATHCATLPMFGVYIVEDEGMDMANSTRPHMDFNFTTREACLKAADEAAEKCRAAIASASDEHFAELWPFRFGEQFISNENRLKTFRLICLNHLIHHTAQLGVYLRLNGIPVPALYGPSADEQW